MESLYYPLRYGENLNLKTVDNETKIIDSEVRHYLETLKGERAIYDNWGVPIEVLFESEIPDLLIARIDIELAQVIPNDIPYEVLLIDYSQGILKLQIQFLTREEVARRIQNSLIAIYSDGTNTIN